MDEISFLVRRGRAKNYEPSNTVLVSCVLDNNSEGVLRCLKAGLNPNNRTDVNEDLLSIAIKNENLTMVKNLLQYGAKRSHPALRAVKWSKNKKIINIVKG